MDGTFQDHPAEPQGFGQPQTRRIVIAATAGGVEREPRMALAGGAAEARIPEDQGVRVQGRHRGPESPGPGAVPLPGSAGPTGDKN